MASADDHKKTYEQFMEDINEKIRNDLLIERQKIISFAASEASTNYLEYLLHKKGIITAGFRLNHNYFVSEKRAERYLEFEFPMKKELINLMVAQEDFRNILCYGKEKERRKIEDALTNLRKIIGIIKAELGEQDE